ncbi:hypothetical protein [Filimonas effusa]|uniref:DUF4251 domain-containing protein n=1 Tax=Filimonas effusa TaxID=2508721 RepID=A0A4Q1D9J8_9BACT|nr:hypothetical protein [Filimonas effusa]RXK85385.1 hypothetical protein ESB13_00745 [Filimonas effusa]
MCNPKIVIGMFMVVFFSIMTSCRGYADTADGNTSIQMNNRYFQFYPDSNIFKYESNIALSRDEEKILPKAFKVKLPKGMISYEIIGSTDFCFFYEKKQVVYIKIDLENKAFVNNESFIYTSKLDEVERLVQSKLVLGENKYDITKVRLIKDRKQLIMKKTGVSILLYNIKPDKLSLFRDYVSGITLLN